MKQGDWFYIRTFCKLDGKYRFVYFPLRFRLDPVPDSGKFNHKRVRPMFRRIKTTQERRWSLAHKKYVRGRRSFRMLPEQWDDYRIADDYNRGWKRTKKKRQWM